MDTATLPAMRAAQTLAVVLAVLASRASAQWYVSPGAYYNPYSTDFSNPFRPPTGGEAPDKVVPAPPPDVCKAEWSMQTRCGNPPGCPAGRFRCHMQNLGPSNECLSFQPKFVSYCSPCTQCKSGETKKQPCRLDSDAVCQSMCSTGNYMTQEGQCEQCTVCAANEVQDLPCSPYSDRTCKKIPCPSNHFRNPLGICQVCTDCPSGQYPRQQCTPETDRVCESVVCPSGQFLGKEGTCSICSSPCGLKDLESPCQFSSDRTCNRCPTGMWPDKQKRRCTSKPCEYYEFFDGKVCRRCPRGMVCSGGSRMVPCIGVPDEPERPEDGEDFICLSLDCADREKWGPKRPSVYARPGSQYSVSGMNFMSLWNPHKHSGRRLLDDGMHGEDDFICLGLQCELRHNTCLEAMDLTNNVRKIGSVQCIKGTEKRGGVCALNAPSAGRSVAFRAAAFATLVQPNRTVPAPIRKAKSSGVNRDESGWVAVQKGGGWSRQHFNFDVNGTSLFTIQPKELVDGDIANITITATCRDTGAPVDELGYNCSEPFVVEYEPNTVR